MKTFKDLEFKEHELVQYAKIALDINENLTSMKEYLNSKHAVIEFDNGRKLSVIFGSCFDSNGIDTYEAMELNVDSEPRGYLTEDEVTNYMLVVQGKAK